MGLSLLQKREGLVLDVPPHIKMEWACAKMHALEKREDYPRQTGWSKVLRPSQQARCARPNGEPVDAHRTRVPEEKVEEHDCRQHQDLQECLARHDLPLPASVAYA